MLGIYVMPSGGPLKCSTENREDMESKTSWIMNFSVRIFTSWQSEESSDMVCTLDSTLNCMQYFPSRITGLGEGH